MAKLSIVKGATSVLVRIFVQDSASTTGAGKTGLTAASFTGTKVYVGRDDDGNAGGTAVTLTDSTRGTWSSGGIKEKDATNMPGVYEFGLTNASLATGSRSCTYEFIGTGIAPLPLEIELTGVDNGDGVRGGMTALPNAAANAAGGLPVSSAGSLDLDEMNVDIEAIQTSTAGLTYTVANQVDANALKVGGTTQTGRDIGASVLLSAGTGTGQLDFTSGVVKANATQWLGGTIPAVNVTGVPLVDLKYTLGTISPAAAGSVGIDWAQVANPTSTIGLTNTTVGILTTYTGNTKQTGDNYARLGAPAGASVSADVAAVKTDTAAVKVQTDKLTFTVANQVDANPLSINGDATGAANLAKTTRAICRGTAGGSAITTSIPTSAFTPGGSNVTGQFIGRTLLFDANTSTVGLQGQASNITASTSGATPTFTVTALTTAPASGDTFSIV